MCSSATSTAHPTSDGPPVKKDKSIAFRVDYMRRVIVEALYPEGVETSRLDVGELVTITIYAPDVEYGVWVVTEVAKVISTADVAVSAVQG